MKINHIGIAVENIELAKKQFEELGFVLCGEVITDRERKIRIQYLSNDEYRIELVTPLGDGQASPVDRFIKKNQPYAMYHVCYEVDDMKEAVEQYKNKGYYLMEEPRVSLAMDGCKTAYLFQKNMGFIEFVEVVHS